MWLQDIPVDMGLSSGTTALHLASFAGEIETVKLLKDVYKAEINKQDRSVRMYTIHQGIFWKMFK